MKNYDDGLIKACAILTEAWQDYFDDEVISKDEFKPIDAFCNTLMNKFNKELMNNSNNQQKCSNCLHKEYCTMHVPQCRNNAGEVIERALDYPLSSCSQWKNKDAKDFDVFLDNTAKAEACEQTIDEFEQQQKLKATVNKEQN